MAAKSIEIVVREMADREAIRDLACRYAHYVWSRDVPAIAGLFTDEGEMDMGNGRVIQGKQHLLDTYREALSGDEFHPFVHNHVIDLQGDRATGTCYLDLRSSLNSRSMIGSGRYDDQYVKVGDEWRFRSRKLTMSYFVPLREGWVERRRDAPAD